MKVLGSVNSKSWLEMLHKYFRNALSVSHFECLSWLRGCVVKVANHELLTALLLSDD